MEGGRRWRKGRVVAPAHAGDGGWGGSAQAGEGEVGGGRGTSAGRRPRGRRGRTCGGRGATRACAASRGRAPRPPRRRPPAAAPRPERPPAAPAPATPCSSSASPGTAVPRLISVAEALPPRPGLCFCTGASLRPGARTAKLAGDGTRTCTRKLVSLRKSAFPDRSWPLSCDGTLLAPGASQILASSKTMPRSLLKKFGTRPRRTSSSAQ